MIQSPKKLVFEGGYNIGNTVLLSLMSKKTVYMSRYVLFYFKMNRE